jgi:predicted outer membrane repeat protein
MMPLVGCGETTGAGGSGGSGGTGGTDLCEGVECDDGNECTDDVCDYAPVQEGATCGDGAGTCQAGSCVGTFSCTEQGIRDAIAVGGGPHTFDCDGPTTVVTEAEIVIDNDVILDGEGNLIVDGNENHRVFAVPEGMTVELRAFTVTEGSTDSGGGGIWNVGTMMLTNSTVSGNTSESIGGGVYNYETGTLTLTNSTVSGNSATVGCCEPNTFGGGIVNVGTLTLTNSTVSGNTALGQGEGGGIYNQGTLTLTNNSTVSGNTAPSGGGISNLNGTLTLTNSTVSGNTADARGGGIYTEGTLTLTNTLVDNDCDGTTTVSGGGNLESPGDTCGFNQPTDQVNVTAEDLNLGPLQDNDGPTQTHALLPGSVALDAIAEAMCEVNTDQRGVTRPQGPACDVGAFELEVAP